MNRDIISFVSQFLYMVANTSRKYLSRYQNMALREIDDMKIY